LVDSGNEAFEMLPFGRGHTGILANNAGELV
jgi:hypothetical protein